MSFNKGNCMVEHEIKIYDSPFMTSFYHSILLFQVKIELDFCSEWVSSKFTNRNIQLVFVEMNQNNEIQE